jgi:hypothetical protein
MSRFYEHAARILEAAERAGDQASELTVLINHEGRIRIVQGSDWPLAALQEEHGACMGYQVKRSEKGIRITAREGARTCTFESENVSPAVRLLSGDGIRRFTVK